MPTLKQADTVCLFQNTQNQSCTSFHWELCCAKCVGSYGFLQHSLKPTSLNLTWHAQGPPTVCFLIIFAHKNGKCFLKLACFSLRNKIMFGCLASEEELSFGHSVWRILKKVSWFPQEVLSSTTVFNIINKKCFLSTKLAWMISEWSCDTKD